MIIRLGFIGLLLVLFLVLWLTSTWNTEGFDMVNTQVVKGRYLRLEKKEVGCINLAEIAVYSDKNGENIIRPTMKITKSSTYGNPDHYPEKNFIDGNPDTMLVTSCNDVGWILIDLGSVVPIYKVVITNRKECCRQRANGTILSIQDNNQTAIYIANPIKDKKGRIVSMEANENSNMTDYYHTFTYFPPYPVAFGDVSPSMSMDPPASIDSVRGYSTVTPPTVNLPDHMLQNETVESCRQKALSGNYVAWGYRKDNHPTDGWKNSCFFYENELKPYSGNPQDGIHLTGCLRPGEKLELGCKVPNDPSTYQPHDRLKCRTLNTPFNDEGGGNAVYLDRHDLRCESNEMLGQFRLVRNGAGQYRYDYTCCKVASPPFSEDVLPSSIKALPGQMTELKQMQQKLSATSLPQPIQEAPTKLAILEAEVKRLQEQLIKESTTPGVKEAPAKLAALEAEVKRLQEQLVNESPDVKEAPAKLAALQAEVQQIQQKLLKSSNGSSVNESSPATVLSPDARSNPIDTAALALGDQSDLLQDIQQVIRDEIRLDNNASLEGFFSLGRFFR
jgi:uncharacterized small protein (DUF1192 family)